MHGNIVVSGAAAAVVAERVIEKNISMRRTTMPVEESGFEIEIAPWIELELVIETELVGIESQDSE